MKAADQPILRGIATTCDVTKQLDCLQQQGINFIGRYYGSRASPKILSSREAHAISAAGMRLVILYEDNPISDSYFTRDRGKRDGETASRIAADLGQPAGSAIYFAVDYDATQKAVTGRVAEYFEALQSGLRKAAGVGNTYEIGVYGSGRVCQAIKEARNLAKYSWLAESTGWGGSNEYKADLQQTIAREPLCGLTPDDYSSEVGLGDFGSFTLLSLAGTPLADEITDPAPAQRYPDLFPLSPTCIWEDQVAEQMLGEWKSERPDVVALATVASVARRVEPELLRALRLGLNGQWFANGKSASVASEAALWFSPLIESRGPDGLTFSRAIAKPLRQELLAHPNVLEKAWAIVKRTHRQVPPVVQWEEKLTYLGLKMEGTATPACIGIVNREVDRALKALHRGEQPALGEAILKMGPRLPVAIQRHHSFAQLAVVARAVSDRRLPTITERGRARLDFSGLPRRSLLIATGPKSFRVAERLDEPDFAIEVPALEPIQLQVLEGQERSPRQTLILTHGMSVEVPAFPGGTRLRASDGKVYRLRETTEDGLQTILELAANSALARHEWQNRGRAPLGYLKGMAVTFARVYAKLVRGNVIAIEMAKAAGGDPNGDALVRFRKQFDAAGMDNTRAGADTLRHLFVFLVGLGMRESSGMYSAGRDKSSGNVSSDTAEAGLFQASYNLLRAHPLLNQIFEVYLAQPSGFLDIFREGVQSKPEDLRNYGTGHGVEFQRLSKECPAFAVETAALGLRLHCSHWAARAPEISPHCDDLLREVQGVVDRVGLFEDLPAPIQPSLPQAETARGFVVRVQRVREERVGSARHIRTVSEYQCYWEGERISHLSGVMIERGGPGDNRDEGIKRHRRLAEGNYPLAIQDGTHYKTNEYHQSGIPEPAILLEHTGQRSGSCILPLGADWGNPACLSPIAHSELGSQKERAESRQRVIAIIEALKAKLGGAFPKQGKIPGAMIVIEGEPAIDD